MPPNDVNRLTRSLAKARDDHQNLLTQRNAVRTDLAAAEAEVTRLDLISATESKQRAAARRVDRLRNRLGDLADNETKIVGTIGDLRDRLRLPGPEASVRQLDGRVPVTLLPVRIETRFGDGNTTLRVRVFPEQVHIDTHEPELTESEIARTQDYWRARWTAGADVNARAAAWTQLTQNVRATRARWLVAVLTPTNIDTIGSGEPQFPDPPKRADAWTRAPEARLLPEQWVVLGYRNGTEVLRAWAAPIAEHVVVGLTPDPDATAEDRPPTDEQETLPVDDALRWLFDYDDAVAAGMAVTVTQADLTAGRVADGVDELVVLGVDWSLKPDDAAAMLADQFGRHAATDGLALLAAGTPTNNTDDDRAAPGTDPRLDAVALDPAVAPSDGMLAAGGRLARAFGLAAPDVFARAPGHGHFDDGSAAADMNIVLWAPTFGYFFDQMMRPLMTTDNADRARAHFVAYVRGRGSLDTVRIGKQPYGVLPVTAGAFTSTDAFEQGLAHHLDALRPFWQSNQDRVGRLGDTDRPDADLVDLLRRTPRSVAYRFRQATGASVTFNVLDFAGLATFQLQFADMLLRLAGIDGSTALDDITLNPAHRSVPVPLVASPVSETEPLETNYIDSVRARTTRLGAFIALMDDPAESNSLLEALLREAGAMELALSATRLTVTQEVATGVLVEPPSIQPIIDHEIIGIEARVAVAPDAPDAPVARSLLSTVSGASEIAEAKLPAVTGDLSLADFIATQRNADLFARAETKRFGDFRAALQQLAPLPSAELDRLAADTLDCASHRLDAWITSLAARRLEESRADQIAGCHIGGFGYVEDLHPRAATGSLGFLHAPSLPQAATAAVLRSAHLAHRDDGDALAIDLSSTRVALALELIEGVRRGQPIGALLGYRFERGVQDRRLTLMKYVLPLRQAAPLATTAAGPDDGTPVEAIAARDVVDGVALIKRWQDDRNALYDGLSIAVPDDDRKDLDLEIAKIDDALDAVSDLLVAESVHQAVLGNSARAAAALDALDRQTIIPDIAFASTPRSGSGCNHRLLLMMQDDRPADGWDALADARRATEPRVNAWAGAILGPPDSYRFAAEVHDADGNVIAHSTATLPDLGLSALGTVCACVSAGAGGTTELEERLVLALAAQVDAAEAAGLVLLDDPPAGSPASALGLRDVLELGAAVMHLLSAARPADARALGPESERPAAGHDHSELRTRADAAVAALVNARNELQGLPVDAAPDAIAPALLALAAAGRRNAVPTTIEPGALAAHAATELATASQVVDQLTKDEAGFDRTTQAGIDAEIAHDLARVAAVFGTNFPVVPMVTAPAAAALSASMADAALLGDDVLAPASWLAQHALVRPAAARLANVLTASEMLVGDVGLDALHVMQLPYAPGDPWIGLPRDPATKRPVGSTGIVAHAAAEIDVTQPLAALVIDTWFDTVPNDYETTGVSFHFDAPGAQAPQAMLVAVPGDPNAGAWTVESLAGAVREAMALARIRALDLDDLDAVGRFLPAIYLPFNIERRTPSINIADLIDRGVLAANATFTSDRADYLGTVQ